MNTRHRDRSLTQEDLPSLPPTQCHRPPFLRLLHTNTPANVASDHQALQCCSPGLFVADRNMLLGAMGLAAAGAAGLLEAVALGCEPPDPPPPPTRTEPLPCTILSLIVLRKLACSCARFFSCSASNFCLKGGRCHTQ